MIQVNDTGGKLGDSPVCASFFIGVVFLILGWRWQYLPNNEIIIAMKGMVRLKSEIHKLEEDMLSLNKKLENKLSPSLTQDQFLTACCSHNTLMNQEEINSKDNRGISDNGDTLDYKSTSEDSFSSDDKDTSDNRDALPEKFQQILELADCDLTVPEISEKLGMSQDAVIMVMRTATRRKQLDN